MRLHAENPDLTYDEVMELALRSGRSSFREGEPRYEYTCRQCGDAVWVGQKQHDKYQYYRNNPNEIGSRSPKCGACWL
jgi:hypothetical protein